MIRICICIFCEGKTEYNYIQELSRLLDSNGIYNLQLVAKNLGGLNLNNYFSKLNNQKLKSSVKKGFNEYYAWIDFDIFKRENKTEMEIKNRISNIGIDKKNIIPLFNVMNGEDFFILHQSNENIEKWIKSCNDNNHFNDPMHSCIYIPLLQSIFPEYKKGQQEELSFEILKQVVINHKNSDIPFSSDIIKILEMVIEKIEE